VVIGFVPSKEIVALISLIAPIVDVTFFVIDTDNFGFILSELDKVNTVKPRFVVIYPPEILIYTNGHKYAK